MLSDIKGRIVAIRYEVRGTLKVTLDGVQPPVVAADTFNQLAVDAAFERRAPVVLELDGDRIRRVQSDLPEDRAEPIPRGKTALVTRMSTQVDGTTGDLIAEVFFERNPGREEQARTTDPVVHLLCHGAYVAKHRLMIDVVNSEITAVLKERID